MENVVAFCAVDELRAELDGKRKIGEMQRGDTAADAIPRLEKTDSLAGAG